MRMMFRRRILPTKDAGQHIQSMCEEMKPLVEEKTGRTFDVFTAKSYGSRGDAYCYIKVHVGGIECLHLCVNEVSPCFGGFVRLIDIQHAKTLNDPIEDF